MGPFQFLRMPLGLSRATATFQRLVDSLIEADLEPHAFSYLDDIIIVLETFVEHLRWLEIILRRITDAGLTIKRDKSFFCWDDVKFLGCW